jgi:hypothetical protein
MVNMNILAPKVGALQIGTENNGDFLKKGSNDFD